MKKYILNNLLSYFFGLFLIFSSQAFAELSVFDITEDTLRKALLESFDPYSERIRWSVLSAEILIREFVHQDDHHNISDEFRTLLKG